MKLALNTTNNTDGNISLMHKSTLTHTDTVPVPLGQGLCPVCVQWGQEEGDLGQLFPLADLNSLWNTHKYTVSC